MAKKRVRKNTSINVAAALILAVFLGYIAGGNPIEIAESVFGQEFVSQFIKHERPITDLKQIPPYSDRPYVKINSNEPFFKAEELDADVYESYAPLDYLGRCGSAKAMLGRELMPTQPRGAIGMVKPSGWKLAKYKGLVDGGYLYNRCHLIAFMLAGENANEKNLITGTRYMNTEGMLPFEIAVSDYIKQTGNHVLYRVTPIFEGENLLASGVLMEAKSVEDGGEGLKFNVYCYNAQPGVIINYANGQSELE